MNEEDLLQRLALELDERRVVAQQNAAVACCASAWMTTYCEAKLQKHSEAVARSKAAEAYKLSLPALSGTKNVRDLIACATHGMLIGVFNPEEANRLFYAAQVANSACRSKAHPPKTNKESDGRKQKQTKSSKSKPFSKTNLEESES